MAFTSAISGSSVFGNKRCAWGTYTSAASSTGGDIDTGLEIVEHIQLTVKASAIQVAGGPVVNETLPIAGSAVTIVTVADGVGYWFAFGR